MLRDFGTCKGCFLAIVVDGDRDEGYGTQTESTVVPLADSERIEFHAGRSSSMLRFHGPIETWRTHKVKGCIHGLLFPVGVIAVVGAEKSNLGCLPHRTLHLLLWTKQIEAQLT